MLVFTAPSSPFAHPWAVVVGNTLSAVVGMLCAVLIPQPWLAASLAVAGAIALMMLSRSLHPPGGAVALLGVLAHHSDGSFVLFPVFTNSVILVVLAMFYNQLSGHFYPAKQALQPDTGRLQRSDVEQALVNYREVLDVAPNELVALFRKAESAAYQRLWSLLSCHAIMTPDPVKVDVRTSLLEAVELMRQGRIKALPVVDASDHVVGIVTQADVLRHAQAMTQAVGQVMTRQVRVASAASHALDLLPLFSEAGHHHLPIIDEDKRLVGILTQTDLMRALSRVLQP